MRVLSSGWTAVWLGLAVWPLFPQKSGRFCENTRRGIDLVEKGKFTQAINVLEPVWEQDHSDPAVAENLAVAYLYSEGNITRASDLMQQAMGAGGRATFLVQHVHEKSLIGTDITNFCEGRLSIYRDRVAFISGSIPEHSFTIPAGHVRDIKTNRSFGKGQGMYHLTTAGKQHYNLRPRSWSEAEADLVLGLISKQFNYMK